MTCPETWFGEQAASYCTISSHIGSSSSSNFPLGLPPLKKTSYNKLSPYSLYHHIQVLAIFQLFWLFGQANGKITIKFRIAFGCLGSESHAPRRSSMNLMEIMAIGQWDHCKPWMINNQLWPIKDGWRRWGTYVDLWGIIPTAYGDLNVGDEALH